MVGGGLNALGVVRSLAKEGVDVTLLAGSGDLPAARSRHARCHIYDDRAPGAVVEALVELARRNPGPRRPLILTEEEKVAAVSHDRARLEADYVLGLPPADVVQRLLHKDGFRAAAEAGAHVVPATRRLRAASDLGNLAGLVPPLVIKPAGRQPGFLARYARATRVESLAEAEATLVGMLEVSDDLVVQEWVAGDDSMIYFCLQFRPVDGTPPMSFVGRKLRAWPRQTGGTARCVAAPEAVAALVPLTTRFFSAQGVTGLASMEYKWRAATQDYVMIEPTIGRTDHQEEIATLNGVNLPWVACCHALGLEPSTPRQVVPVRIWKDEQADINAAAVTSSIAFPGPRDARVVDALWRFEDPVPWFLDRRDRGLLKFRRIAGRLS